MQTRLFGFINRLKWETNTPLEKKGWKMLCIDDNPVKAVAELNEKMSPYFTVWLSQIGRTGDTSLFDGELSLIEKTRREMEWQIRKTEMGDDK
ncbi:hypothetical protein QFZ28_006013 [Neobacillus niacini]|uniref:hypothetical protein n=1 Tax=Neobacillus niacini TaxID=86668 RepID=UPI00277FE949|nr:hypothetical protein [Neobacillus niacini]MDQ1005435.1 hypothetical protein [Neobacillus niacini]